MRRILIPVIIALILLIATPTGDAIPEGYQVHDGLILESSDSQTLSTAGGFGNNAGSVANISRSFSGILTSVLNSYSDVSTHSGIIDLSNYQVPGWTLYNVTIIMNDLTAIAERDSLGIVPNTDIIIQNNSGIVTDSLYQEFYNEIYDGKLDNYTITCRVDYYLVAFGHSYLGVRSNFSDSQTNTTGWITPWVQNPLADVDITHDTSGDNAILNASTPYYVTIDGTKMIGASGLFNTIKWKARTVLGLETGYNIRGDDWYIFEGGFPREAVLNYTYTPWNTTANAPIAFSSAEEISLAGNSTPLTGNTLSFASGQNITAISLSSNQSADVNYNITLLYMQNQTTATSWYASASGASIDWNATTTIAFPILSGITGQYLDVPKESDWTATGLYNSTAPSIDYGNYSSDVFITHCANMTNGTWTLTFTAHNYVTLIETQNSVDSSVIGSEVNITVDMDIISTIEDASNNPEDTGDTNLTVLYGMSSVYAPANISAVAGHTQYLWDIDSTTSNNGTYVIEIYWTNGTEAGYLTKSVFVYFPTTFSSNDAFISAYTDDTFDIRVDYNET
ncbi:MAG: hypothetical protein ACXAEB_15765, partial [Candidatus Thorarchaeota archaeon]